MKSSKFLIGLAVGASALYATASFAATSGATCSKAIDVEAAKVQTAALKAFQACNDAYWKDALGKTQPPTFSKAAPACDKQLSKLIATAGTEEGKIAAFSGAKCSDADLALLGHLTHGTFGDKWAQYQVIVAVQEAYEQQIGNVRNFVEQQVSLAAAAGCPTCAKFQYAPCYNTSCNYLGGSAGATVNLNGLPPIPVTLIGTAPLKMCDGSTLLPSTAGTLFVTGGTGKNIEPAAVGAIAFSCPVSIGAEGFVTCSGSAQKVSYTTCQDHHVPGPCLSGATSCGGCTGQDVCQASAVDKDDPTILNGGACIKSSVAAGVSGDAYVNNTTQIRVTNTSDGPGGDGLYCTPDDPSVPGVPATTPLTTGTASSIVHNVDDQTGTDLVSDPDTGTPFTCGKIPQGILSGAKLVGAFPAMNSTTVAPGVNLDDAIAFSLVCE